MKIYKERGDKELKIIVVGNPGCSRCEMARRLLKNKEVDFEYQDLGQLSPGTAEAYLSMGEEAEQVGLPILIKEGKLVKLEDIIRGDFK